MRTIRQTAIVLCFAFASLTVTAAEEAAVLADAPPVVTLGAQGGDGVFEGFGDILAPFYLTENGLWFVNPRLVVTDEDEEELNVGLGYRHLFPDKSLILGANVYYDSRWTQHDNQFNQLGLGVEMLSAWVDARANYYLPEDDEELIDSRTEQEVQSRTSTRWYDPYAQGNQVKQKGVRTTRITTTTYLFERFEQAQEGWDAEVGVKLPGLDKWVDVRVFGGYYSWDSDYAGGDRIEGAKGRLEVRVLPALYLDAMVYEDEELNGSDWAAGGRLVLPFDTKNLSEKKNPFEGAFAAKGEQPFANRLLEMVIRDLAVRTEESDWIEDVAARQVETEVTKKSVRDTLMKNVTFVDGDNLGMENGTAEHPYDTIQEGVDNANSPVVVFPQAGGLEYVENVLMPVDVQLYGACAIVGHSGKRLGGRPTVDGRAQSLPAISMADDCLVAGFRVWNTGDLGAVLDPVLFAIGYERAGIYAGNATDFRILNNIVENCSQGAMLVASAQARFEGWVTGNTFRNNTVNGALMGAANVGLVSGYFVNNLFANNAWNGLRLDAQTCNDTLFATGGNAAFENGMGGFQIAGMNGALINVISLGDFAWNNGLGGAGSGFDVSLQNNTDAILQMLGSTAVGNLTGHGINIINNGVRPVTFIGSANASGNGVAGLNVNSFATGAGAPANLGIFGLRADNNGGAGVGVLLNGMAGGAIAMLENVTANRNGILGITVAGTANGPGQGAVAMLGHVQANNTVAGNGINVNMTALQDGAGVVFQDVSADNNMSGINVMANGMLGSAVGVFDDVSASDNNTVGINLIATANGAGNSASALFDGVRADNNAGGMGIGANLTAAQGSAALLMEDVSADNNLGGITAMLNGMLGSASA
ncbi:MAG: inverse autotransporter beta domain-containing protein, partial [Kiritimatiellae bacterium]|nr:inverse autotransporter beta domain-containing protein [Kiritimatiellia bacterium]